MFTPLSSPSPERSGRRLRARLGDTGWTRVRAVASLGMVFGLGAVGTLAAWSDTATASTGVFSTASTLVKMTVNDARPAYAFSSLTASGLMPMDTTASTLTVKNAGDAAFSYVATATASGDEAMASVLNLTAHVGTGVAGSGNAKKCTGAQIGSANLQAGANKPAIATTRNLNGNASEALCFQVTIANGVTKAAANKTASVVIQFTATES